MPYPYTLMPDGHTLEPDYVPPKPPATTQEESEPDLPWYYAHIFPAQQESTPEVTSVTPMINLVPNNPPVSPPDPVTGLAPFDTEPSVFNTHEYTQYGQTPSTEEEAERREQRIKKARQRFQDAKKRAASGPASQPVDEIPPDVAVDEFIDSKPLTPSDSPDWPGSTPLSHGRSLHVDHLLSVETDTLAREVLIGIKREGIPPKAFVYDFMAQYAEWGWDDLSSARALQVLEIVRNSDWDERLQQADSLTVETVAQDQANDWIEGLVIIDAGSGNVVLNKTGVVGAGGQQYVGLQDYDVEALRGLDLIFVHNHPNDTQASEEDLRSAFDTGAKLLIVITRNGREFVYVRGRDRMVLVRDEKASYEVGSRTLDETIELAIKSAKQAVAYRDDSPEYVFLEDTDKLYTPRGLTVKQSRQLFEAYLSRGLQELHESVNLKDMAKYYPPIWENMWKADPSKWSDYDTVEELSPIILEQAKLWNHPESGMSDFEMALWMIANLHQESRFERAKTFLGLPETGGFLKDKLGDMLVVFDPSLGPANFRPTVANEMLDEELGLPMPGGAEEFISDDQLGANRLDELNSLREEWRNTKHFVGPFGHRYRVLFLSDNENAIKLLAINHYRGVERLVRQDLQPTMFNMFAWQSQGIPEPITLSTSNESSADDARKHAVSALLYLNAIIHNEESFGMTIDSEEWNDFQIFEDDDLQAFLRYVWVEQ